MEEEIGCITRLCLFTEKGKPGTLTDSCYFLEKLGIEGDRHAKGGERQVTLLPCEVKEWMESQEKQGLCFKRYKANIETQGLPIGSLKLGTRLLMGTAVLEVSGKNKECFPECPLFQEGKECQLSSGGFFLKVVKSGQAGKKDKIVIIA